MVVLAHSPGCLSGHEPAWSQGFAFPADKLPNQLARECDSVGKSPAWRGLDVALPSHFVMGAPHGDGLRLPRRDRPHRNLTSNSAAEAAAAPLTARMSAADPPLQPSRLHWQVRSTNDKMITAFFLKVWQLYTSRSRVCQAGQRSDSLQVALGVQAPASPGTRPAARAITSSDRSCTARQADPSSSTEL